MARIWVASKDPGGHNAVWPVSLDLRARNHSVLNIASGQAADIMNKSPYIDNDAIIHGHMPSVLYECVLYLNDEDLWNLANNLPDIFVTSTCSGGGVGRNLIPEAKDRNIPTVAVTDFWTGAQTKEFADPQFWPDAVCAQDNFAKEILMDIWRGYPVSKIHVTGQPAFDKLMHFDEKQIHSRLKQDVPQVMKIGTAATVFTNLFDENLPTVLFAGQLKGTAQALVALIKSLNMLPNPVNLVLSTHPRFYTDSPEEISDYQDAILGFNNGLSFDQGKFTTEEWACVSDLVVSMTSTVLATAGHFRKDCVSILFPEVEKRDLDPRWGLPYERLGTAAVARSQAVLNKLVAQALLNGGLGFKENQEKHFAMDGSSAKRVADVVENTLHANI